MKMVTFYEADDCGTCHKALKFLLNRRYAVDRVDILKQPPTEAQIRQMIAHYDNRFIPLFNNKSAAYARIADELPIWPVAKAIEFLRQNPHLFKRPFVLFENTGLVGFDESAWKKVFPA